MSVDSIEEMWGRYRGSADARWMAGEEGLTEAFWSSCGIETGELGMKGESKNPDADSQQTDREEEMMESDGGGERLTQIWTLSGSRYEQTGRKEKSCGGGEEEAP
jgi:hypothetical protein